MDTNADPAIPTQGRVNLPSIIPPDANPVLLVEGEECRVGATVYAPNGWVVTTCDPTQIDASSYLGHSHVIIWPTNDEGGRRWGAAIVERIGRPYFLIPPLPKLPEHWDLSHELPADVPLAMVHRMLTKALAGCRAPVNGHAAHTADDQAERQAIIAADQPAPVTVTAIDPKAPMDVATIMTETLYTAQQHRTLHHQQQEFFSYTGTHYRPLLPEESKAAIYRFLNTCVVPGSPDKPVKPNRNMVGNVEDALRAVCQLPGDVRAPAWLEPRATQPPAAEVIACKNTLLHLPTRRTLPHTPLFFTPSSLAYDYSPNAPEPQNWLKFLASVWPSDPECVATLQEMFGYLISGATSHQKLFLIVGPKRSGKGTIGKVLNALLGDDAVVSATLSGLETNFGLAPLIGKHTAIIADARLGGKADQATVAERLLSISGEDKQSIDRKFLGAWSGRLNTRFVIMTNEIPRINDASGALASRFIIMTMTNSFFGRERLDLFSTIAPEMPGILNWALKGLARLTGRGYFQQPASSAETLQTLEDLSSPIAAFIRDCCDTGPGNAASKDMLYSAWCDWCRDAGKDYTGTRDTFCKDLIAALPQITPIRPREGKSRTTGFAGVGLKMVGGQPSDVQNDF